MSAGVVAASAAAAAGAAPLVLALGALALLSLAVALVQERASLVPWALLLLGAAAAVAFANEADPGRSPIYAAALLGVAELAYWSLEDRRSRAAVPGMTPRRVGRVTGAVAGALVVGTVLAAVARVDAGGGLLLEAVGVTAAVAAAALVLALSRRAA